MNPTTCHTYPLMTRSIIPLTIPPNNPVISVSWTRPHTLICLPNTPDLPENTPRPCEDAGRWVGQICGWDKSDKGTLPCMMCLSTRQGFTIGQRHYTQPLVGWCISVLSTAQWVISFAEGLSLCVVNSTMGNIVC